MICQFTDFTLYGNGCTEVCFRPAAGWGTASESGSSRGITISTEAEVGEIPKRRAIVVAQMSQTLVNHATPCMLQLMGNQLVFTSAA